MCTTCCLLLPLCSDYDEATPARRAARSPQMMHDDTLALMQLLDTIRGQIGVTYPADQTNHALH